MFEGGCVKGHFSFWRKRTMLPSWFTDFCFKKLLKLQRIKVPAMKKKSDIFLRVSLNQNKVALSGFTATACTSKQSSRYLVAGFSLNHKPLPFADLKEVVKEMYIFIMEKYFIRLFFFSFLNRLANFDSKSQYWWSAQEPNALYNWKNFGSQLIWPQWFLWA